MPGPRIALLAAVVTAAVTFGDGGTTLARAASTNWQVTLVNLVTGSRHAWLRRTWADQASCIKALGTWPTVLAGVAVNDPDVKEPEGADPVLHESLLQTVLAIYQSTGQLPRLGIECEPQGDPA